MNYEDCFFFVILRNGWSPIIVRICLAVHTRTAMKRMINAAALQFPTPFWNCAHIFGDNILGNRVGTIYLEIGLQGSLVRSYRVLLLRLLRLLQYDCYYCCYYRMCFLSLLYMLRRTTSFTVALRCPKETKNGSRRNLKQHVKREYSTRHTRSEFKNRKNYFGPTLFFSRWIFFR